MDLGHSEVYSSSRERRLDILMLDVRRNFEVWVEWFPLTQLAVHELCRICGYLDNRTDYSVTSLFEVLMELLLLELLLLLLLLLLLVVDVEEVEVEVDEEV